MKQITLEEAKNYIPVKEYYGIDRIKDRIRGAKFFTTTPSKSGDGWEDVTYYTDIKRENNLNLNDMSQETENKKINLVNDLIATSTVMEELWKYHPENPSKIDIVEEYANLEKMKKDIEAELDALE